MCLVYTAEREISGGTAVESEGVFDFHVSFARELKAAGKLLAHPATTATSIIIRGGSFTIRDGPFAENDEILSGFYLIESRDLDEAIGWAKKIPTAAKGTVEIRPVVELSRDS